MIYKALLTKIIKMSNKNPLNSESELGFSVRVSNSYSTWHNRRLQWQYFISQQLTLNSGDVINI